MSSGEIAIYTLPSGAVEVRLEKETVWLRQEQMAELFGRDRTVIGRHIRNAFIEGELERVQYVQILHILPVTEKPTRSSTSIWTWSSLLAIG